MRFLYAYCDAAAAGFLWTISLMVAASDRWVDYERAYFALK
uniref:Uncharacterized protein n=1 Tax=mine drainage metagenome TaxID=410659 RepID=E6PGW5_9ZZZZ